MKTAYASAFALALALAAGPAAAETPDAASVDRFLKVEPGVQLKTRDQVRAELATAQQTRDNRASDQLGRTVSEAYPSTVPSAQVADAKSRQQVRGEAIAAQRSRDNRPSDQFGRTVAETRPSV